MFEITDDDIALLDDEDLRELVGRLCESELRRRGISPSCVTWGGNQNAGDGGVDVRVTLPPQVETEGFIPRPHTGFQAKAENTPPSKIITEMRPKGVLRPSIRELAEQAGAYVIVSSIGSVSDTALRSRKEEMALAVSDLPNAGSLYLDFYDRRRLETWVRDNAGTALWVRERIGKPLSGWAPFGAWSYDPDGPGGEYFLDDKLRIKGHMQAEISGLPAIVGIQSMRDILRFPKGIVRLIGLSGVGKTRLVQALFDERVGEHSLDRALAAYTNFGDAPNPHPVALANEFIKSRKRAILVIDNCAPDLHQRLTQVCSSDGSELSLITIEFDIREDQAEGTDVFVLEVASVDLTERLVKHRFLALSPPDARRIAEFSGGNARIALALAGRIDKDESIAKLSDEALFVRLFHQRHRADEGLLLGAQALSLVYQFEGENVSNESGADLSPLGGLVGKTPQEMFRYSAELEQRGLIQRRGRWRAVLPHAIANRLAAMALKNIPKSTLEACFNGGDHERLLKSFSRRLGYLNGNQEARVIASGWLSPGGMLENPGRLDDLRCSIFNNIAPVDPESTLSALERSLHESEASG